MKLKLKLKLIKQAATLLLFSILGCQLSTAWAQNTMFTYQGSVLDNGNNFTGSGQFKFALVTSTNANHTATATVTVTSGFVTSIAVNSGGNSYTTAPKVTIFGGGGSGATATASINGGAVTGIAVNNPGSGYASPPTVLIAPPPPNLSYTSYWSNDGTSVAGSEPAEAVNAGVSNGLFTLVLGDATQPGMTEMDAALFAQPELQLRIWFNDGVEGFAVLDPAQPLTPAPYAIIANSAIMARSANSLSSLEVQQNTNGAPTLIGGALNNFASGGVVGATIGGGGATNYQGSSYTNSVTGDFGTVSGGYANTAGNLAAVGGGNGNTASGYIATVGGGEGNTASGNDYPTVGGGGYNTASGLTATVGGGFENTASGSYATVAGGISCIASGYAGFAAGVGAQAMHSGSFVWADASADSFSSTANNQFSVHATGGVVLAGDVQIGTSAGDYHHLTLGGGNSSGFLYGSYPALPDCINMGYNYYADSVGNPQISNSGGGTSRISAGYSEIVLAVGDVDTAPTDTGSVRLDATLAGVAVYGTFNNQSDRNAKRDFAPVSPSQILDKVARLPVSEWSYKVDSATRHIGPVAQDFYSVFNIGTDDKHIAPMDIGGVALAAIQALNQKLHEQDQELQKLREKAARVDALEKQLHELAANVKWLAERK
jgi:trimeric autotransporter adhesin